MPDSNTQSNFMNSVMGGVGQAVGTSASGLLGGLTGMLFEKHNDKRQLNQQQALQNMQIQGQEQLTDYNTAKQLQMWKDTSYPAQMQQLQKAGLNPGLMYGMGGGGGQTASIAPGSVSGAEAPTALELQNEIGPITWTRVTAGQYQGQITTEFPNDKTAIHAPQQQNNGGNTLLFKAASNIVALQTSVGGAYLDDLLTNTRIEINIYN